MKYPSFDPNILNALHQLGSFIQELPHNEQEEIYQRCANENPWFTPSNIDNAFKGLSKYLNLTALQEWGGLYPEKEVVPKKIGIVMAGNIPLVGLHDLLAVLVSGHHCKIKTSSKDSFLINYLVKHLVSIESGLKERIEFVDQLKNIDAVIATGSDNSARYFQYYFSRIPNIIRKNRTGVAILTGNEQGSDLVKLADDIFMYFGLGCRNVSKLYLPRSFSFDLLIESFNQYQDLINHHKYANNYDYQKSILLVNRDAFIDTGFLLMKQSQELVSPISMLFFDYYDSKNALSSEMAPHSEKIQVIVSSQKDNNEHIPFGEAQFPELWDYADRVNTLDFLFQL